MKIQNTLVYNIRGRSQRYFAHVTTVSLSWRVQNIVVIGRVYSKLDHSECSSNFEFDRNMLSGTGARPSKHATISWVLWSKGYPSETHLNSNHEDVINWKHFPRYWSFVRGIHRSPHKGQWRGALMFSVICVWINDSGWWFETPSRSLWRQCNVSRNLVCP